MNAAGRTVDLTDTLRADYPQPSCPVCGRFARRGTSRSWEFACSWWDGARYVHD